MTDTQGAIAAFLAKGGKVTKAAVGEGNGMTHRQWYRAARDSDNAKIIHEMDIDAEQREEIAREAFGAARLNGASQSDALDVYNQAKGN